MLGGSLATGAGLPWPLIAVLTVVQRGTPGDLLGRVVATASTSIYASTGPTLHLGTAMVTGLDDRVQVITAGTPGLVAAAVLASERYRSARTGAGRTAARATSTQVPLGSLRLDLRQPR